MMRISYKVSYKDILSVFLYKYHVFTLSFFIKGNIRRKVIYCEFDIYKQSADILQRSKNLSGNRRCNRTETENRTKICRRFAE